jgi:hypothetical protein
MKWRYLGILALVPLLIPSAVLADSGQPLSLTMTGGISSVGGQTYILNQHGSATYALVQNQALGTTGTHLDYSLFANVHGGSVSGQADIRLSGTSGGQQVRLQGRVTIQGMVPIEPFSDGSSIPSAFIGTFAGTLSVGGTVSSVSLQVSLESPFINPFGGPVVVASSDGSSLVLVSGYQSAKIIYSNVQVFTLTVTGTVGTTPVSAGTATLTTWAVEDLGAGTETEVGSIAFMGMTPSFLDSKGFYFGKSVIPGPANCLTTYGFAPCTVDCTSGLNILLGLPSLDLTKLPGGLCTVTGFVSSGHFFTQGQGVRISGDYSTVWDIPAVSFGVTIPPPVGGSTITGTVSQH